VFNGSVWRVVRAGRSVFDGSRGFGRWNSSDPNVRYTAHEADAALAETHFHLSPGQSVFPSRMRHALYELYAQISNTLRFADMLRLVARSVEEAISKGHYQGPLVLQPDTRHRRRRVPWF
jgi:hypothetical protein